MDDLVGPGLRPSEGHGRLIAQHLVGQGRAQGLPQIPAAHELRDDGAMVGLQTGAQEEADVGVAQLGGHSDFVQEVRCVLFGDAALARACTRERELG